MAKKSRRARKQRRPTRLSDAQMFVPEVAEKSGAKLSVSKGKDGLEGEYRYVVSDLKRIAIIAAIMLTVMIILAVVTV
jgi:hypothetical protein